MSWCGADRHRTRVAPVHCERTPGLERLQLGSIREAAALFARSFTAIIPALAMLQALEFV